MQATVPMITPSVSHNSPNVLFDSAQSTPRLEKLRANLSDVSIVDMPSILSQRHTVMSPIKESSRRVLSTMSIVGLCYFAVSGGPIGSEPILSSGGPLVGFIGLVAFPLIWSIPIAYVTAELSTAFPEDGGYTIWVLNAFGPFWAFQTGYWAWISGVIDNAMYPALAMATFTDAYGSIGSPVGEYFIKAVIAIGLALPNLLGIRIVGNGMAMMSIFVMVPFCVLAVWAFIRGNDYAAFGQVRHEEINVADDGSVSFSGPIAINWSLLINTLFWNFNGAVGMSVFGGEVHDPGRTYPRAMVISIVFIVLTYLVPLSGATIFNTPHWSNWDEGSFSGIAKAIGGVFLSNWIVLATFCSNAGMYIAELFCDSFQILGMAECDLAPAFLKARNKRFDTPHNAVFASLVIILVLIKFEFEEILGMTNALSAFYQLLILFAFIKLRFSHPDVERPVKVPGSISLLVAMLTFPAGLLMFICVDVFKSSSEGDGAASFIPAILVTVILLFGFGYARWKKFTSAQFHRLRLSEC